MNPVWLGSSGFSYPDWRGEFYPTNLSPRQYLPYYARYFNSVEINSSFYRLPRETTWQHWFQQTPANFRFMIKAPRLFSHYTRLQINHPVWQKFRANLAILKQKLAGVLFQLPASFPANRQRLRNFLQQTRGQFPRLAFEFRHPSWFQPKIITLLQQFQAGLVWHDCQLFPQPPRIISGNFLYLRFHGVEILYNYEYSPAQLENWAKIIKKYRLRYPIFAYFNNDPGAAAIRNARQLAEKLHLSRN